MRVRSAPPAPVCRPSIRPHYPRNAPFGSPGPLNLLDVLCCIYREEPPNLDLFCGTDFFSSSLRCHLCVTSSHLFSQFLFYRHSLRPRKSLPEPNCPLFQPRVKWLLQWWSFELRVRCLRVPLCPGGAGAVLIISPPSQRAVAISSSCTSISARRARVVVGAKLTSIYLVRQIYLCLSSV